MQTKKLFEMRRMEGCATLSCGQSEVATDGDNTRLTAEVEGG